MIRKLVSCYNILILFFKNSERWDDLKSELDSRVKAIRSGKAGIFDEVRSARSNLVEKIPHLIFVTPISIIGALAVERMTSLSVIMSMTLTMIAIPTLEMIGYLTYACIKYRLRIIVLNRMGIKEEDREDYIAAMESCEYNSLSTKTEDDKKKKDEVTLDDLMREIRSLKEDSDSDSCPELRIL